MSNHEVEMMTQEHERAAVNGSCAEKVAEAAAAGAVSGYKKIEEAVVTGYKKIETGAVEGFGKVVDKCVEVLFARDGESVEDAKKRLNNQEEK